MQPDIGDRAGALFDSGLYCAESVLTAMVESLGIASELIPRIATGFCSGMSRTSQTCGAVTGAFMVLGLKYGDPRSNAEAKERTYEAVREFSRLFKERHGSILCRKLLGCDIGTPEGMAEAKNKDLFKTICSTLVRDAAEILEGL